MQGNSPPPPDHCLPLAEGMPVRASGLEGVGRRPHCQREDTHQMAIATCISEVTVTWPQWSSKRGKMTCLQGDGL